MMLICSVAIAQDDITSDVIQPTYANDCMDGSIDLDINGGFAPYDVEWYIILPLPVGQSYLIQSASGVNGNNDGEDLENVGPGTYAVVIIDELCGEATMVFELECECPECELSANIRNANCEIGGSIRVDVKCENDDQFSAYSYLWSDGFTGRGRSDLESGEYCLTITDINDCEVSECWEIKGETGMLQVIVSDIQNISECNSHNSGCNGYIDIEVLEGSEPFKYTWTKEGGSIFSENQDVSGLCEGTYTVTIVAKDGCKKSLTVDICCCLQPVAQGDDPTSLLSPGNCYSDGANLGEVSINIEGEVSGLPDASITTTIVGGTGNQICMWEGPDGFISSSCSGLPNITKIGRYCLSVDDGCQEDKKCFEIVDCSQTKITVEGDIMNTCDGVAAGSISLSITGGTPPYSALWGNGSTEIDRTGLPSGVFCVNIKDRNGCEAEEICFTIGSEEGEIENTTIPCSSTLTCNGQTFETVYYNYEILSLECNEVELYCPATEQIIFQDLGYVDVFASGCDVIGICQDGTVTTIASGSVEFGPFLVNEPSCQQFALACADLACNINGQLFIHPNATIECALALGSPSPNCPTNECLFNVFCGTTPMGVSFCSAGCFGGSSLATSEIPIEVLQSPLFIKSNIDKKNLIGLYDAKNKVDESNNQYLLEKNTQSESEGILATDLPLLTGFDVSIFPNPVSQVANIKIHSPEKGEALVVIIDLVGKVVDQKAVYLDEGINNEDIQLGQHPNGLYIVQLIMNRRIVSSEKISKQ